MKGVDVTIHFDSFEEFIKFFEGQKVSVSVKPVIEPVQAVTKRTKKPRESKKKRGITDERAAELRELCSNGRTLKALAEHFGVSQQSVSNWKKKLGLIQQNIPAPPAPPQDRDIKEGGAVPLPPQETYPPLNLTRKCHLETCRGVIIGKGMKDTDGHEFCGGKCYRAYANSDQFRLDQGLKVGDKYVEPPQIANKQFETRFDLKQVLCKHCGGIGMLPEKFMTPEVRDKIDKFKLKHKYCKVKVTAS